MKGSGCIALTPFPYTDLSGHKMRPVLLLRQASVQFDDWLVCMVSSQLQQADEDLDEFVLPTDPDFRPTGLKTPSVLRLSRLAVIEGSLMAGSIGSISDERLWRIKQRLSTWILDQ